ncbi:DUF1330 domain-containing protein [Micromonospora sp. NPDC005324]|uniref:DUF1330 domain-containing protein n=1 Tax=Micromonospora sp. NPDC005324 TaxID=3157033 RepID=UPI0033BA052E
MTAFVISEVEVCDQRRADSYRALAAASIDQHGGRYLARGRRPEAVEGSWPDKCQMVIIEFPSMQAARRWYASPEYAQALEIRQDALDRRLLFVEGNMIEGLAAADRSS